MKNLFRPLKNERGIAILVALFAIMLMIFIATEVSYDTSVEYVVARQQVSRLKAYYAARAGVEMSLLRILIYKKAVAALSETLGGDQAQAALPMLDPLWSMDFIWPPKLEGIPGADQSAIADAIKESTMDTTYNAKIIAEGGRLDLNDLASASKPMRDAIKMQVLKVFQSEVEQNEKFAEKYRDYRFEELVNNMIDWVDEDKESLNGGDERSPYEIRSDFVPPNVPFKTVKELNMVAGMNEDFFTLLAPRVTIFGTKGINVNYAPKEVIRSLDPAMTEDALNKIVERRTKPMDGGPYKNEDDFFKYAALFGVNVNAIQKSGVPLIFGPEYNFRIVSTGYMGNVRRDITAITFDTENIKTRYLGLLDKEATDKSQPQSGQPANPTTPPNPTTPAGAPAANQKAKIVPPKGRPTVVYWEET